MPKGSIRNPGTEETYAGRTWQRAKNRAKRQVKKTDEAYAWMNKRIDERRASKTNTKLMRTPGAGRVGLTPIKRSPGTRAKKPIGRGGK